MENDTLVYGILFLLSLAGIVGMTGGMIWMSHSTSQTTCEDAFGQGAEWESTADVDGENVELCQLPNGTVKITQAEPIEGFV